MEVTSVEASTTSIKAFVEAFVEDTSVEGVAEAFVESYVFFSMEDSINSMKYSMKASMKTMEASTEAVEASTEAFMSFHASTLTTSYAGDRNFTLRKNTLPSSMCAPSWSRVMTSSSRITLNN